MASVADQYLIFGVLALQLGFVTKDALGRAMSAWLQDQRRPLGELLLDHGDLEPEHFALLRSLIHTYLKKHGDDAQQSLAAMDIAPGVLESLAEIEAATKVAHAPLPFKDLAATRRVPEGGEAGRERFRILRAHAEGGVGRVWVARDEEFGREVALKEIKEAHSHEPRSRARFVREAVITGGLEHPGIVPVYSLGAYSDGRPYYAMRFIRGDNLMAAITRHHKPRPAGATPGDTAGSAGTSLDLRQLLGRFIDVCQAIQYAHDRGVLHRDLKPGNILLGKYGETLVVDWGLAKVMDRAASADPSRPEAEAAPGLLPPSDDLLPPSRSEPSDAGRRPGAPPGAKDTDEPPMRVHGPAAGTMEGIALGTPAFMSPEQAAGRHDQLGPASDVYSLGATLYCILTGKMPFENTDVFDIIARVQRGDFLRPREVHPGIDAALEAVCLKAMALEPRRRYAGTQDLANDVEHWLADEPVTAWREPATVKLRRFGNRHRVAVATAAAVLLVGSAGLIAANVLLSQANVRLKDANDTVAQRGREMQQANKELTHANVELEKSEKRARLLEAEQRAGREKAETAAATIAFALAKTRFEQGQDALAQGLMDQVAAAQRGWSWGLLKNTFDESRFTLFPGASAVSAVAFSADGQLVAAAADDGALILWDAHSGTEKLRLPGHHSRASSVAVNQDSQMLASGGNDGLVKLCDPRGKVLRTLSGHRDAVACVAFSPDGHIVASGSFDGTVRLWDTRTGEELGVWEAHRGGVKSVAFSPSGDRVASAGLDKTIKLWNADTGAELRVLTGHRDGVLGVAFSPDSRRLVSGSADKTVKLWDVETGKELRELLGHAGQVHAGQVTGVAFSPDGQTVAAAGTDGAIRVWEVHSGEAVRMLRGHYAEVTALAYRGDGQMLVSASTDKTLKFWNVRTGQEVNTLRAHTEAVKCVAVRPDGRMLATGSWDRTIRLWDIPGERVLHVLTGHKREVADVAFAPGNRLLASASSDGTVKVWDADTGDELRTLRGHKGDVVAVAFSLEGHTLASASTDKTIKLWDARNGRELRTLTGHTRGVTSVAFADDGRLLASGGDDQTVRLWDPDTGVERQTLTGHKGVVKSVAWDPRGVTLASASVDGTIKLWDATTGRELRTLRGHGDWVLSVAFSPGGDGLASGSRDRTIKLWDARSGQELRTLQGHLQYVDDVAFSRDGAVLFSASADRTTKLWDVRPTQELRVLRGHQGDVVCTAFDAAGTLLATGGATADSTIKLWDVASAAELRTLAGRRGSILALAFSTDSRLVASASANDLIKVWEVGSGKELQTLTAARVQPVAALAFSADGAEIYAQGGAGERQGWSVTDGTRRDVPAKLAPTAAPTLSPDGATRAVVAGPACYLIAHQVAPAEADYRTWVSRPDAVWHEVRARSLDEQNEAFGAVMHLGAYLAAQRSGTPAEVIAWPAPQVFAGVILKDSRMSSAWLVEACAAAVKRSPARAWPRALHGGALHRAGKHKEALDELTAALALPDDEGAHLCSLHFLAAAHQALGSAAQAKAWNSKATPSPDAPWSVRLLDRCLRVRVGNVSRR